MLLMHKNCQFEPVSVWSSSPIQFFDKSTNCSFTKPGKNWFEQCEPVWTSSPSKFEQFDSVSAWKLMTIYTTLLMHN